MPAYSTSDITLPPNTATEVTPPPNLPRTSLLPLALLDTSLYPPATLSTSFPLRLCGEHHSPLSLRCRLHCPIRLHGVLSFFLCHGSSYCSSLWHCQVPQYLEIRFSPPWTLLWPSPCAGTWLQCLNRAEGRGRPLSGFGASRATP